MRRPSRRPWVLALSAPRSPLLALLRSRWVPWSQLSASPGARRPTRGRLLSSSRSSWSRSLESRHQICRVFNPQTHRHPVSILPLPPPTMSASVDLDCAVLPSGEPHPVAPMLVLQQRFILERRRRRGTCCRLESKGGEQLFRRLVVAANIAVRRMPLLAARFPQQRRDDAPGEAPVNSEAQGREATESGVARGGSGAARLTSADAPPLCAGRPALRTAAG